MLGLQIWVLSLRREKGIRMITVIHHWLIRACRVALRESLQIGISSQGRHDYILNEVALRDS